MKDVAHGTALMTGTELQITFDAASADLVPNVTLARMIGVAAFSNVAPMQKYMSGGQYASATFRSTSSFATPLFRR